MSMPPSRASTSFSAARVDSTIPIGWAMDRTTPSSMAQKKESEPSGFIFWMERQ